MDIKVQADVSERMLSTRPFAVMCGIMKANESLQDSSAGACLFESASAARGGVADVSCGSSFWMRHMQ